MSHLMRVLTRIEEGLLVALFVILIAASAAQVMFRFAFDYPLDWTEELARLVFVLLIYVAASAAIRRDMHVRVEAVDSLVPPRFIPWAHTLSDLLWLGFTLLIALYGFYDTLEKLQFGQKLPALQWPLWITTAFIPASFLLMAVRIVERIVLRHRHKASVT